MEHWAARDHAFPASPLFNRLLIETAFCASCTAMLTIARRNPAKRMARFYKLALQPTLPLGNAWAGVDVVREWGRIGSPGQVRSDHFATEIAAVGALRTLEIIKRRKGYQ
jgi:predicted DNA-binding WGR domain protein